MAFTVHTVPGSPYGRAVLATLEEKRATYRIAPVAPGTLNAPAHLARHPFGKVPVLEHDGFTLYETQAILRYLDRILPAPALTPGNAHDAARMDQAMNLNDWYLFHGVATVISLHRIVRPRLMGLPADEAAVAAAMPRAIIVFAELARLLGEQEYFAGADLSLADMMLLPQIEFLSETPEWAVLGTHRNIVAWLQRMAGRPSMQATTWEKVSTRATAA
jgi:glutathione S-transferase